MNIYQKTVYEHFTDIMNNYRTRYDHFGSFGTFENFGNIEMPKNQIFSKISKKFMVLYDSI